MRFRLRYLQHDFELSDGQFVIGRSAECQLSLDDPLVSRRHALLTVTGDDVTVQDLGSRNGMSVNGDKIQGVRQVQHGDQIVIGSQEMMLLRVRDDRTETQMQSSGQVADAFGLLANLADKAFALGKGAEAERILSAHLDGVLQDVQVGERVSDELAQRAAEYASRLALATGQGRWVNYIVQLYAGLAKPCPASVVDSLYSVLRKVDDVDLQELRDYVELLRNRASSFGPTDRFLLSRIEGLERLAALK